MTIRILAEAEAEYEAAALWYDEQRTGLGDEFLDELTDALQQVDEHPRRFPKVTKPKTGKREVRHCLLPRFPYRVVYELRPDEILVLAVAHAKRRPGY